MADTTKVKFKCEYCGKKIGVPSKYAGRRVKCPGCEAPIQVPDAVDSVGGDAIDQLSALAGGASAGGGLRRMAEPGESSAVSERGVAAVGDRDDSAEPAGPKTCPQCGARANPSAKICVDCGHGFGGLNAKTRAKAQKTAAFAGRSGIAIVGGLFAALAAGVAWAAVARYTGMELGILAWGLGFGVGLVVALVARTQNDLVGIGAGVVALAGWGLGKVLILYWAIPAIAAAEVMDLQATFASDMLREDYAIQQMYETGAMDAVTYNQYENGELSEEGYDQLYVEVDEWLEANETPDVSVMQRDVQAQIEAGIRESIMEEPLYASLWDYEVLEAIDILWIFLMLGSAWKIGSGVGFTSD